MLDCIINKSKTKLTEIKVLTLKREDIEKIDKYIQGISDEAEKDYVNSLFIDGENNPDLRDFIEKDWKNFPINTSGVDINLNRILDRIHHIIHFQDNYKKERTVFRILSVYRKIAAILLLPLVLAGILLYITLSDRNDKLLTKNASVMIYAPMGSRVAFNLPDGTKGMLNSGSHLTYSLPFIHNRTINLEGEAWFEVTHDIHNPFKINAGSSLVKVLGTSFNLSAYQSENYIELVLLEGEVEFSNSKLDEKIKILPSERLILQNDIINKSTVDPLKYNAWTNGKLVFRGDPMTEVVRRIERWYNVKIELADKELENYSFRATFQDDKLEEVLKFLSLTSPIKYQITPRQQLPDGTFDVEKATIYLKK